MSEENRSISPEDQAKAQRFFGHAKTVADTGNYEYAIELYLQGLAIDPDSRAGHQALREVSLIRKAAGGKDLGMFEKAKLKRPTKDDKQNLINAAKLLAYDPGNTDHMLWILQAAHRAGFRNTVMWIGPILLKANADSGRPDASKYIALKNVYADLRQWAPAAEACQLALRLRPDDNDLQSELKRLATEKTMEDGKYQTASSFTDSVRNFDEQKKLMEDERDVKGEDVMLRRIREAESEFKQNPDDLARMSKYVDALEATEDPENENRAIEVLEEAYQKTRQFRFRQRVGKIKIAQMSRMERSLRQMVRENPKDESLKRDYEQFHKEMLEFELAEYRHWADAYPSDLEIKYKIAERLFELERYDEAIPLFQQARQDPKLKVDGSIQLGRSFLSAGFVDEAIDTLQEVIEDYQLKGDDRSKELYYWQGRAHEEKGNIDPAIKRYSQVAQWEFTYRDVQQRIKALRAKKQV